MGFCRVNWLHVFSLQKIGRPQRVVPPGEQEKIQVYGGFKQGWLVLGAQWAECVDLTWENDSQHLPALHGLFHVCPPLREVTPKSQAAHYCRLSGLAVFFSPSSLYRPSNLLLPSLPQLGISKSNGTHRTTLSGLLSPGKSYIGMSIGTGVHKMNLP